MFGIMSAIRETARMLALCGMLAGGTGCGADSAATEEEQEFSTVEVSTVGMDMISGSPVVLLRQPDSGQIVPIWVGISEAQAILRALHGIEVPRPMTHDLMGSLLSHLDAKVVAVIVHDLRDNTYYGRVQLKRGDEERTIDVDSRPSDAIALALRTKSPVRVARKLFADVPGFEFMPPEGAQQVVRVFGVTVVSPSPELRQRYELPDRPGVIVRDVSATAEGHGLEAGDLIMEVNEVSISTPMEFFDAVMESTRGEPVRLRVLRQDQERAIEIPWDATDPHLPPTPTRPGFRV
jgi:uncharacterized protein